MKRLALLALLVLPLLPYLATLHHPLLHDDRTMLDNRWLAAEAGPVSVFQHDFWNGTKHESSDLYRPLTVLSLAWNVRAAGTREGVRAVNLGLHVLATLGLFLLMRRICRKLGGNGPWPFLGAALFAVHPLASESVLFAVGRAEILSATFGMGAFGILIGLEDHGWRPSVRIALSSLSFFAALACKESAVSWLAIAATYFVLAPSAEARRVRSFAPAAAAWLVALLAFLLVRGAAVGWATHPPPFVDNPLVAADGATRAANAVLLFARYLAKMVWPGTLSIEYGFDQIPIVPLFPWAAIGTVGVAAATIGSAIALKRAGHAAGAFLVLWLPAGFAITGNLAFPIGTIFAERLAYLPLAGFCALVGLALARIPTTTWRAAAAGVLVVACAARTIARGRDFRDLASLSEATADASPRAVKALFNEARSRYRQGHAAEAIPLLERAVAIWPDYTRAKEILEQARRGGMERGASGEDEGR